MQILTERQYKVNEDFEIVFKVEAFAGVDAYEYYLTGLMTNPDEKGRDTNYFIP